MNRLAGVSLALLASGCAQFQSDSDNYLLYGTSNVSASDAVGAANQAIRTAAGFGCKPISVGGGTGLAGTPPGVETVGEGVFIAVTQIPREYDVYVIVECPEGTPELLPATGGAVSP